jgi:hypothetical protein
MVNKLKQLSLQLVDKFKQLFQRTLTFVADKPFFVKFCNTTQLSPPISLAVIGVFSLSIIFILLGSLSSPDADIDDIQVLQHQEQKTASPASTVTMPAATTLKKEEKTADMEGSQRAEAPIEKAQVVDQSFLAKVESEQQAYVNDGHIEVWDNSTGNIERSQGEAAYISFSNDYNKPDENQSVFSGKEFIYANLHLTKKLADMLPDTSAKGLQYYRVTLKASIQNNSQYANGKTQENSNKIQRTADFSLGHDTDTLVLAVVPEKGFFEGILNNYRENGKFADRKTEEEALRDLLARNFSRQLSLLFKKQEVGEHQVEIEFSVTAKLSQEKFVELKNMKGTFMLNIDEEAKKRYQNTFDMLTKLYQSYDDQHTIAELTIDQDKENEMVANMSPREKERYTIAKNSPLGYMAAYEGEKFDITFQFSALRDKHAYIDVTWPRGSCEKCEEGSTGGLMVTKRDAKTFAIPVGARVSLNGNTLIKTVDDDQTEILFWYY